MAWAPRPPLNEWSSSRVACQQAVVKGEENPAQRSGFTGHTAGQGLNGDLPDPTAQAALLPPPSCDPRGLGATSRAPSPLMGPRGGKLQPDNWQLQ